jgi:hypothetical protein
MVFNNLNWYTLHGHEKSHVNLFFHTMLVDWAKEYNSYKMEVVIKKGGR